MNICIAVMTALLLADCATPTQNETLTLEPAIQQKCLKVLREGLHSDQFWPSIHAAEGLTLGGYGDEVIAYLEPMLPLEKDDQQKCGLTRELVRAGQRKQSTIMLKILAGDNDYGHIHAAESLYKVNEIGDGKAMRRAFEQTDNLRLRLMSAAALGRKGDKQAMNFLRETLAHEDAEISRTVGWVLGRIGDESDIPRIKKLIPMAPDDLTKAYYQHSLASLGDSDGLAALAKNLKHEDGSIRTYAATFAGDARAVSLKVDLIKLLDDSHVDAQIRAAQTLLFLSRPVK
ncbi:MAG: HEAT repeat domain-containing protein [Planctomycetaceae bacterium]|jgi:sialidase-1|nr:HEAT repeat domain-containing protein [Planctomycetaceae bacterium]MDG2387809.1 HEAT repeat domain-containing protein [Planctomycetaceae bacterium]